MKFIDVFRKLSLLVLLASLLVGLVGMIKSSYVEGLICTQKSYYNSCTSWMMFDVGLINHCNGQECMKTRDFLKANQDEWNTVTASLIIETIFKGGLIYALFQRHAFEFKLASNLRTFRIAMVSLITLSIMFGGIAMGYANNYMYSAVDKSLMPLGPRMYTANEGMSILLMKVSLGLSAGGFLAYCIIWAIEICKDGKAQGKVLDDSYLPFISSGAAPAYVPMDSSAGMQAPLVQYGAGQQQSMQPMTQQHVSLVIDGQTVTALLIPSGAPAVGSSNVVSGPIVYLPNANSGYAPPAETSSSAPALPARPPSQVSMYPSIGSTSFPA